MIDLLYLFGSIFLIAAVITRVVFGRECGSKVFKEKG
jgi:hypothetical protein